MIWRPWREIRRLTLEVAARGRRIRYLNEVVLNLQQWGQCQHPGDGRPCILPKEHDGKHFTYSRGVWE